MADTKISNYIIGVVIFVIIMTAGLTTISEFNQKSGGFADPNKFKNFETQFNRTSEIASRVSALEASVSEQPESGLFGVLYGLINIAWNTLKLLPSSFSFMATTIGNLTNFFSIPAWFLSLIASIIVIIIVFKMYDAVFQGDT